MAQPLQVARWFAGRRASVRAARRFVRATLVATGVGVPVDAAELLASELATNAVLHTRCGELGSAFQVTCSVDDGRVRVAVRDAGALTEPRQRRAGPLDTAGRGLALVEALADRWGMRGSRVARVVWFELGLPGRQHTGAGADGAGEDGPASDGAGAGGPGAADRSR